MQITNRNPFTDEERNVARRYNRSRDIDPARSFTIHPSRANPNSRRIPFLLRLPPDLADFLEERAAMLGMSRTALIVTVLETWRVLMLEAEGESLNDDATALPRDLIVPQGEELTHLNGAPLGLEQL